MLGAHTECPGRQTRTAWAARLELEPPMAGSSAPGASFWAASEACIVCQSNDFCPGYGPRTMVTCESCLDSGVHVECWHRHNGELLTEERLGSPAFQWFCSEVRSAAAAALERQRCWPCLLCRDQALNPHATGMPAGQPTAGRADWRAS